VLPHCHCQLPISVHSPFIVEGKIKKWCDRILSFLGRRRSNTNKK
jgi:hypothetical protein